MKGKKAFLSVSEVRFVCLGEGSLLIKSSSSFTCSSLTSYIGNISVMHVMISAMVKEGITQHVPHCPMLILYSHILGDWVIG